MSPKPRPQKPPLQAGKDASPKKNPKGSMPPPPAPTSRAILEPEVNALSGCLKNAAVKLGEIYRFYADTHRLGIGTYAPKPPRSLTDSLGREVEKYDQIVDAMEVYLVRAIATLQRDLRREEKRIKDAEEAAIATRTRSKSASLSPTSKRTTLPALHDEDGSRNVPNAPVTTAAVNSPPIPSSSVGIGRRPSAISISSLHRPAFPLKLDLSSAALHMTTEEPSMFPSGLASPVTLAPRSARAVGHNEFASDFIAAFASSSQSIDLTMDTNNNEVKMTLENVGGSADKPIELDLDGMDIDMAMNDLFGDSTDSGANEANDTMTGLFSPSTVESNHQPAGEVGVDKTEAPPFLENLGKTTQVEDIFSSLNVQGGSQDSQNPQDPQHSKEASSLRSAPSPASMLASFTSVSRLPNIEETQPNSLSTPQTTFDDISSLDLSNLNFFGGSVDTDMNFSMDMDQFLATVNDGKQDGASKNPEDT